MRLETLSGDECCARCLYFCPARTPKFLPDSFAGFCGKGWTASRIGSEGFFCSCFERWEGPK